MESRESTTAEVSIDITDDLRLVIENGTEATCYTNVYYEGEHLGRLNSPSKPWEQLSLVMTSQVVLKKTDAYDSRETLDELQYEAMCEHRTELDEVFGWPDEE